MSMGQLAIRLFSAISVASLMQMVVQPVAAQHPPTNLPAPASTQPTPRFSTNILPILERKCITCHACYDAPCQLVMSSPQGLLRGATKKGVYDAQRLSPAKPSRLFRDGQHVSDWRRLGFFSILKGSTEDGRSSASLLMNMLRLGRKNSLAPNRKIPPQIELGLHRKNACPAPSEFTSYAALRPHQGMPLGTTGLTDHEFALIESWVASGAPIDERP